jgi:hypothetical protein
MKIHFAVISIDGLPAREAQVTNRHCDFNRPGHALL